MSESKNKQIAETMKMTFERRRRQDCRVFELKVNRKRLNKQQEETLKMMFVEAKWCYNYILAKMQDEDFDLFSFKGKELSTITHKDKDGNDVEYVLHYITSSLKDALVSRMQAQVKTLATLRSKGKRVGSMRFKSDYTSIGLKQLGVTHKIVSGNRIKVQGIKKPLLIHGLEQLDRYESHEIANAILHKCGDDYYIYLTVYTPKADVDGKDFKNEQVGIDFGCQTSLTMSDGTKVNAIVEETERLKRLQKKMFRQKKGSNNRYRTICAIQKEYRKNTNRKDDKANKIVHRLLSENRQIIIQDEQLHAWHAKHGKKVQHGILGRVKERLMRHPDRVVVLSRLVPTTKFCHDCGHVHKDIQLSDREFICPTCGCIYDRDVHAAQNMVWIYNNLRDKIGLDESNFKRGDFDEEVRNIFCEWDSQRLNREDATPLA